MYFKNIEALRLAIVGEKFGKEIRDTHITGASYIYQTTQFQGTMLKYKNYYVLARVDSYFGACAHEREQLDLDLANEISGNLAKEVLNTKYLPIRIAVMDAFLGNIFSHKKNSTETVLIQEGTPIEKANSRDKLIAKLANIKSGEKIALIGVVEPLVKAIKDQGGICLPCDYNLTTTSDGQVVESDMEVVLEKADKIISTAMTLSNGTFDRLLEVAREKDLPFIVYAQTGSAIIAQFVGQGVTALLAEPFPFTQFSGGKTEVYLYY